MKTQLTKLTMAAQSIIYDAKRGKSLLDMMDSPEGCVQAVHTVMSAVNKKQKIKHEESVLLAPAIFLVLVDFAKGLGKTLPPKKVQQVIKMLMDEANATYKTEEQPTEPEQPAPVQPPQPTGMIGAAV